MEREKETLTTIFGAPVGDNQNSLTIGSRGPVLMEDIHLVEKLAQFNRERIPERVVHAKGVGAHGNFRVTHDISRYTSAQLFSEVGQKTPVFIRFSTVAGERGSADTERDPRGFAVKFYTEQGIWDMVGNNTPVFFIRDGLKFPDFIHSQKRLPQSGLRSAEMQWDFWVHSPEALHQLTILFSDRGIPDGYRFMNGYGSHTYSLINSGGIRHWVKWHLKSLQGIRNLLPDEADRLKAEDPDYAARDLFEAIERGDHPKWRVCIQVMSEAQAETHADNPFDVTKVWPHKDYPLIEVGVMELTRNPVNYFAEVEQAAFSPANIVPGMGFSPDKMLQARLFAYPDAQRYRIGTNYGNLPVNASRSPVHSYSRDGAMRFDMNGGQSPVYEPNGLGGPVESPAAMRPRWAASGDVGHFSHREDHDDFRQAGDLFRMLPSDEKARLVANIVRAMKGVPRSVQRQQVLYFLKADRAYGEGVALGLGLTPEECQNLSF